MNKITEKIGKKIRLSVFSGNSGIANVLVMFGLLLMAVAIPVASNLVQQNQETRGKAAVYECETNADCGGGNMECKNHQCRIKGCIPSCAGAGQICKGETFIGNCDNLCNGTKTCDKPEPTEKQCKCLNASNHCPGTSWKDSCGNADACDEGTKDCSKITPTKVPPTPTKNPDVGKECLGNAAKCTSDHLSIMYCVSGKLASPVTCSTNTKCYDGACKNSAMLSVTPTPASNATCGLGKDCPAGYYCTGELIPGGYGYKYCSKNAPTATPTLPGDMSTCTKEQVGTKSCISESPTVWAKCQLVDGAYKWRGYGSCAPKVCAGAGQCVDAPKATLTPTAVSVTGCNANNVGATCKSGSLIGKCTSMYSERQWDYWCDVVYPTPTPTLMPGKLGDGTLCSIVMTAPNSCTNCASSDLTYVGTNVYCGKPQALTDGAQCSILPPSLAADSCDLCKSKNWHARGLNRYCGSIPLMDDGAICSAFTDVADSCSYCKSGNWHARGLDRFCGPIPKIADGSICSTIASATDSCNYCASGKTHQVGLNFYCGDFPTMNDGQQCSTFDKGLVGDSCALCKGGVWHTRGLNAYCGPVPKISDGSICSAIQTATDSCTYCSSGKWHYVGSNMYCGDPPALSDGAQCSILPPNLAADSCDLCKSKNWHARGLNRYCGRIPTISDGTICSTIPSATDSCQYCASGKTHQVGLSLYCGDFPTMNDGQQCSTFDKGLVGDSCALCKGGVWHTRGLNAYCGPVPLIDDFGQCSIILTATDSCQYCKSGKYFYFGPWVYCGIGAKVSPTSTPIPMSCVPTQPCNDGKGICINLGNGKTACQPKTPTATSTPKVIPTSTKVPTPTVPLYNGSKCYCHGNCGDTVECAWQTKASTYYGRACSYDSCTDGRPTPTSVAKATPTPNGYKPTATPIGYKPTPTSSAGCYCPQRDCYAGSCSWQYGKSGGNNFQCPGDFCSNKPTVPAYPTVKPTNKPNVTVTTAPKVTPTTPPASCKQDKTGANNPACCCVNSDCPGTQQCNIPNGYCKSGSSCNPNPGGLTKKKCAYDASQGKNICASQPVQPGEDPGDECSVTNNTCSLRLTPIPTTTGGWPSIKPTAVPTIPTGPLPTEKPINNCDYSLVSRVHKDDKSPWVTDLAMKVGEKVTIGCIAKDAIAKDVRITVKNKTAGVSFDTNAGIINQWTVTVAGNYEITCKKIAGSCNGKASDVAKLTVTANGGSCPNECPKTFSCFQNGTDKKWFADGYQMTGYTKVVDTLCTTSTKPTFLGKGKGDANCSGVVDGADYSIWRKEYQDEIKTGTKWEADFNCDNKTDGADYSLWRRTYIDFNGGNN